MKTFWNIPKDTSNTKEAPQSPNLWSTKIMLQSEVGGHVVCSHNTWLCIQQRSTSPRKYTNRSGAEGEQEVCVWFSVKGSGFGLPGGGRTTGGNMYEKRGRDWNWICYILYLLNIWCQCVCFPTLITDGASEWLTNFANCLFSILSLNLMSQYSVPWHKVDFIWQQHSLWCLEMFKLVYKTVSWLIAQLFTHHS